MSPLPPEKSGIADYSGELLPFLAQFADVTLYAAKPDNVNRELHEQFEIRDQAHFPSDYWQYDLALYQMGNSEFHESLYPYLLQYPGVVVLHDQYIHHFIAHGTMGRENFAAYARELGYVLGEDGMHLAQEIRRGKVPVPLDDIPLNRRILDVSLGLIVHSEFVAENLRSAAVSYPVRVIPHFAKYQPGSSRREELGLAPQDILFASLGLITQAKQIEHALETFSRLRAVTSNVHYLLVGDSVGDVDLDALIQQHNLTGVVHHVGYVSNLSAFIDWIHTADVIINLRYPTVGETSGTALRAMAIGKPVVVYNHGWYGELPDTAAFKLSPLDQDALLEAMVQLAKSSNLRHEIGQAASEYTAEFCHPSTVAKQYASALYDTLDFYIKRYA